MDLTRVSYNGYSGFALIGFSLLGIFAFLIVLLWLGWFWTRKPKPVCPSPYSGLPLRRAADLSYASKVKVANFLATFPGYDNQLFKFSRAALCRETGRIFPNGVTWYGKIQVDWNFLQLRYPGHYVSWGTLDSEQKQMIRQAHGTLEGFQTEISSSSPSLRQVEPLFAFAKPGPLYVDLDTKVLLGWQCVPDTVLEVLIVKKPLQSLALPRY